MRRGGLLGGGLWGLLLLGATPARADAPERMQVATSEPAACVVVPKLHDCSQPPPQTWPASELFSFVISCPPASQNEPAPYDGGGLGQIAIEQTDDLGGQCPPLQGSFRGTAGECDGKRLFEYTEPLKVGRTYRVTRGESRVAFDVVGAQPSGAPYTSDCPAPGSDAAPPLQTTEPKPEPPPETWDARKDFAWEASAGPVLMFLGSKRETALLAGGTISFGFRSLRRYESGNSSDSKDFWPKSVPGMIWCAPIFCGGLGLIIMPPSAIIGTELGGDLRVSVVRQLTGDPSGVVIGAGVRPVLRVATPNSRFRAASLLGAYLPEIGVEIPTGGTPALYADWGMFPFTAMIGRGLAIEWNHRVGPKVELSDGHVSVRVTGNLSLVLP